MDAHSNRHKITTLFGEQGSFPFSFANPCVDWDYSPAVCDTGRDCFQVTTRLFWDGNEEIGGGTAPIENFASELDEHWHSIPNTPLCTISLPTVCVRVAPFRVLACGRAWILFGSRKNSKPEKCLKMPQTPTRQVHPRRWGPSFYARETAAPELAQSILRIGRHASRTKQWRRAPAQFRGAPWFPVELI